MYYYVVDQSSEISINSSTNLRHESLKPLTKLHDDQWSLQ